MFIDIVGYSKLLINDQSDQLQKLKQIVRGTEQFRLAEAEGKLLRSRATIRVSADWPRPNREDRALFEELKRRNSCKFARSSCV